MSRQQDAGGIFHRLVFHERRAIAIVFATFAAISLALWYGRAHFPQALTPTEQRARDYVERAIPAIYGLSGTVTDVRPGRREMLMRVSFPFGAYAPIRAVRVLPETTLSKTVFARDMTGKLYGKQEPIVLSDITAGDTVVVGSSADIKKAARFTASHIQLIMPFQE